MDERTDQIVSLMSINDDIKPYSNGGVIWFGYEDCYLSCFYEFTSFVRFSLIFMDMKIR